MLFRSPQLYESQFKKDGDHYVFSPDGTTWSSLEIPVDEWFDFEIGVDPTAVNKRHNTLYVTINGVTEELKKGFYKCSQRSHQNRHHAVPAGFHDRREHRCVCKRGALERR